MSAKDGRQVKTRGYTRVLKRSGTKNQRRNRTRASN